MQKLKCYLVNIKALKEGGMNDRDFPFFYQPRRRKSKKGKKKGTKSYRH